MAITNTNIATEHPDYIKMAPFIKRMRDTLAGEDAIKAEGQLYLPPINVSDVATSTDYQLYLANAQFYNATGLTYDAFLGMIFRKPTTIGDDDKASENDILENVDYEGTNIETFIQNITEEVAAVGRVGILYDFPSVEDIREISVNEARDAGIRPFLKQYIAENIINWKYKTINGIKKLVTIVLKEMVESEDADSFSHDEVVQYRVLSVEEGLYTQTVYDDMGRVTEESSDILLNGIRPDHIPFVVINSGSIGLGIEKPPLLDLANTNLSHYKSSASLGACIHMFGRITPLFFVPTQLVPQFTKQELEYGVTKSIIVPTDGEGSQADARFLEPKSDFTPIVNEMQRLEQRMAAQGARALRPQKGGVEAAETVGLDMMAELSTLGAIANNVSLGLTVVMSWLLDDMTLVSLNTDFLTTPIDPSMVDKLLQAVLEGRISQEQFMDAMITGEALIPEADITTDTDYTPEEKEDTAREIAEVALLNGELGVQGSAVEEEILTDDEK